MTSSSEETRSYEDFDPVTDWEMDESYAILQVKLHGFKKEQLKVGTNSAGFLTVSGERPVEETRWLPFCKKFRISSKNPRPEKERWLRFSKEIRISTKYLNPNEIHHKISSGILSITIPRQTLHQVQAEKAASAVKSSFVVAAAAELASVMKEASSAAAAAVEAAAAATAATAAEAAAAAAQRGRTSAMRVCRGVVAVVVLFLVAYAAREYQWRGLRRS